MRHPLFFLTLPLAAVFSLTYLTVAKAQITPDNSLGAESSVVTPNVPIKGIPSDRIDGGAIRGDNLFHSFQQFNINAGRGAYFSNPAGIANILTRVTGGNISNIQGVLGVLGKANLFLINPNGIIFGPNARLDVGGSFLGSTANSLIFKNGFEFSATNPQAPPLLTITAPVGLSYRENFKNITSQSTNLTVPQGNSLTLVGGNVSLNGSRLRAPGGRVELGGLSAPGTVELNSDGSLSFPVGLQRSDVSLTNNARVNVSAGGGGSIAVNARNLDLSGGSSLQAGIGQDLGTVGSQAGDITLDATGEIKVVGSYIFNDVIEQAVGNGGNINITTGSFFLTNGAQLSASTFGQGNAGNVSVNATQRVSLDGNNTRVFSNVGDSSNNAEQNSITTSKGGNISITTGERSLSKVSTNTTQRVLLDRNNTTVFSNVGDVTKGKGGNISITTEELLLTNGAQLNANIFGQGNAGNISVRASGSVEFAGSNTAIFNTVGASGVGKGGNININAASLSLKDGAQLNTLTLGQGDAGDVIINAAQRVILKGSTTSLKGDTIPSAVLTTVGDVDQSPEANSVARGKGGNISITTGEVLLTDGAQLDASTNGQGNAGIVLVRANSVSLAGTNTGIFSKVEQTGVRNAGGININASTVSLKDSAQITATSEGNGAAGDIEVLARSIRLDNNSIINADTVAGQGNITLGASDYLLLRRGSKITTNAFGTATGGNITINAGNLVAFPSENSDITAKAEESFGGQIKINTSGIFGIQYRAQETPLSDITASSALGPQFSGTVQINTPEIDPTQGLFELTETVVDPAQQVAQNPCIKGFGNSFTITGRGGLPTDPQKNLSSNNVRVDLIQPVPSSVNSTSATQKQPSQKPPVKQIIPAQGWIYNEKGEVVLVAYDPTKTGPQRPQPAPSSSCAAVK